MLQQYLRIVLDTLFPPSSHERLLRTITPEQFLQHYCPTTYGTTISLATYNSRTVQAAVAACKFEKNLHAATLLATLMTKWLHTHRTDGHTILLPIPLSSSRERERGFNQVTRVLASIPTSPAYSMQPKLIERPNDTTRQTSLGRAARLKNMRGAFIACPQLNQTDWHNISRVVICDDVMTTGATLDAARVVVEAAVPPYVKVICVAWAH